MRSYLVTTLAFAIATVSNPIWAEMQQKQLTKEVMLQFEEMDQKGDDSKQEYLIKNPHFFWMDSSSTAPTILGEIDLKGTLKVTADFKGNHIQTESDGITHIIVHSSDPDDQPMNVIVDGKIFKSLDIDFKKIEGAVAQLKAGRPSNQATLLTVLESISKATSEGKNLKITGDSFGTAKNPTIIESAKMAYVHTSGATPEEFTLDVKSNHSLVYISPTTVYKLPNSGKMDTSYDLKSKLPPWSKLLDYVNMSNKNGLPEASLTGKMTAKSKLGESQWDSSFASKKLENGHYLIEGKLTNESNTSPDWVKEAQGLVVEPLSEGESKPSNKRFETSIEKTVVEWLKSAKTTPFLALIPLQSSLDWNGSMEYMADAGNFSVEKGKLLLSLLGKRKTGIQLNFDYKSGEVNSEMTLLGGRPLFDHGVALYNAFGDSIVSYFKLPKFSSEDQDGLFNLLAKYSEQPGKASSELKFLVKYNRNGVTIGGKDMSQFVGDLSMFYQEFSNRQPKLQTGSSAESEFESYKVQQPRVGIDSQSMPMPSGQQSGTQAWPSGQGASSR